MTTGQQPTQLQPANTQQQAVMPRPVAVFRDLLEKMKPQIKLALPRHVDPDRMLRIVLTTIQRTPKLLECTRESLLGCIVQCAQLGLEPDGMLGHAYLIPFFNGRSNRFECQLIVGYKGLLKLARQSGEISSIVARVVHAKDEFQFEFGLERDTLVHRPTGDPDPGALTHAYAIFRLKDGAVHFDVMTVAQINRIRDSSQGYKRDKASSPWTHHYDEMAKKTVIRRASKMAPASIEDRLQRAAVLDERAEAGLPQDIEEICPDCLGEATLRMPDGKVVPCPTCEGASAGGGATPSGGAGSSAPIDTTEFVVSTLKQRKDISRLAKDAGVDEIDVCQWFGREAIDELSRPQAEEALKRLGEVLQKEKEASS